MSAELIQLEAPAVPIAEAGSARSYAAASIAPATLRAYRSGLKDFAEWCAGRGLIGLPASPATVTAYLAALADRDLSVSTVTQRAGAIRWMHESSYVENPTASRDVRSTMAGIRRKVGVAPMRKAPATADRVKMMISHSRGDGLKAIRDRAVLLVGFATAMRRSELVGLEIHDLEESDGGLLVTVRRSKTDQERGVIADRIAGHSRHKSTDMVRVYIRRTDLFRAHPGEGLL